MLARTALCMLLVAAAGPAPGGAAAPGHCGTPRMMNLARSLDGLPGTVANRPSLSGPEYHLDSPEGWVRVHWTDDGEDSTTYDYALSVALAADSSWRVQCCEMGFFEPPPDNGEGGDDRYDIYLLRLSGGVLGYASAYGEYRPPDSTHDCSATHIAVHTGIEDWDKRVCVVAHELQHAVQASYDWREPVWFMENCAVWVTELVYPDIDDYLGTLTSGDNALRRPWMDIRTLTYGGFPWPWMMWDRWGHEAVRSVWEHCAAEYGVNMLPAHDSTFAGYGLTFEQFFMDYGVWRWFTAENWFDGCGMYREEASTWHPGPIVLGYHEVTSLPYSHSQPAYLQPETYGIHWIRVDLSGHQDRWLSVHFDGRDLMEWNLGVIMQDLSGRMCFDWYDCDSLTGETEVALGAAGWDYAVVFPACMDDSPLDHLYDIGITAMETGAEEEGPAPAPELCVSPNPLRPSSGSLSMVLQEEAEVSLAVYDMGGRVAATLLEGEPMPAGVHELPLSGVRLPAGSYVAVLRAGRSGSAVRFVVRGR